MGRAPCCEKIGLNRGPWTREEDLRLIQYIKFHGEGCWRTLPKAAGLLRCGKSCRLRWINYLRPDLKRGNITEEEDRIIIKLHATLGNRWSLIAARLPGRTDNEIKNYWNTHLKKKLRNMGLDPQTHQPLQAAASSSTSHREMFKVDAGVVYEGSMKGRNADSTEELYCRENFFSSSCKLSDVDQKITPSISRINSSVTANCSSSSDIRGKSIDISQVKQELAPEFQATSITNRAAIRSDLYNSDTVDTGPAVISSTTGRAVNCNSNTTNSENRISVDNDPSGFDLHLFSNISSSNALLSLIDNELFWDTQIINMDQQHPRFEEELEAAAADWPHALNELVSSDLWNF